MIEKTILLLKRIFKIFLGLAIVILGLFLIPVPGPGGGAVVFAGIAFLATELPFARRFLDKIEALRIQHFDRLSLRKRRALIAASILGSLFSTFAGWYLLNKFWKS